MALLDVSELLYDPDFSDTIVVKRQQQTTDTNGRLSVTETIIPDITAVVVPAGQNDLSRDAEFDHFTRSINVICNFALRGQIQGYKPDRIVWEDGDYLVESCTPYSRFGAGFFKATCSSIKRNDSALDTTIY